MSEPMLIRKYLTKNELWRILKGKELNFLDFRGRKNGVDFVCEKKIKF